MKDWPLFVFIALFPVFIAAMVGVLIRLLALMGGWAEEWILAAVSTLRIEASTASIRL